MRGRTDAQDEDAHASASRRTRQPPVADTRPGHYVCPWYQQGYQRTPGNQRSDSLVPIALSARVLLLLLLLLLLSSSYNNYYYYSYYYYYYYYY